MTELKAGCKINLGLRITGRREDGYHELDSLFWPLDEPCDTMIITGIEGGDERCLADCSLYLDDEDDDIATDQDDLDEKYLDSKETCENRDDQPTTGIPGIVVECDSPGIDPENNTLVKAWQAFKARVRIVPRIRVQLKKGIPLGAGLGGGSSDAASLLMWLNSVVPLPLNMTDLAGLALKIGADVPFFLQNKPCRVQGIGEKIQPVEVDLKGWWLLLACPGIQIDTTWAYKNWDKILTEKTGELTKKTDQDKRQRLPLAINVANDLEQAVFPDYPDLAELKASLLDLGADHAAMSGSGSTVYGLFAPNGYNAKDRADKAAEKLAARMQTYLLPM